MDHSSSNDHVIAMTELTRHLVVVAVIVANQLDVHSECTDCGPRTQLRSTVARSPRTSERKSIAALASDERCRRKRTDRSRHERRTPLERWRRYSDKTSIVLVAALTGLFGHHQRWTPRELEEAWPLETQATHRRGDVELHRPTSTRHLERRGRCVVQCAMSTRQRGGPSVSGGSRWSKSNGGRCCWHRRGPWSSDWTSSPSHQPECHRQLDTQSHHQHNVNY